MPKYLSQEWLDELGRISQDQPAQAGLSVKVQYEVTGSPDGDLEYYWVIDDGKVIEAKHGELAGADFKMTLAYDDSAAMQQGTLDANAAFLSGKIKVAGNMAKMMSLLPLTTSPDWNALQDQIGAVTEF
jgi:putative sterol carrier protein